jgi:RNase P/RNase MRP subunit p29
MKKPHIRAVALAIAAIGAVATTACGGGSSPSPSPGPTASDITRPGDGVRLGSGWYPIEHYRNLTFRWANRGAEITACPDVNNRTLALLLERGPSLGRQVLTLSIRGNRGDNATATVKPGQYVKISVNPNATAETFVLSPVNSRNAAVPKDKRILNFRALGIIMGSSAGDCKNEVISDGSPLQLGANWYPYETFNGESFRWVDNNAQIKLTAAQSKPFIIEAEVEPGPSLGGAPLQISLRDASGKTLSRASPVKGRAYIELRAPAERANTLLTLAVKSKNVRVAREKRTLNFRVFGLKVKP